MTNRILRIFAWVALLYGMVGVIHFVALIFALNGHISLFSIRWNPAGSQFAWLSDFQMTMSAIGAALALLGGLAAIGHQPWGRVGLIVWACFNIANRVVQHVLLEAFLVRMRATNPKYFSTNTHAAMQQFNSLITLLQDSAFPILYLIVLRLDAFRTKKAEHTRGFELIPVKDDNQLS